MKLIGLLTSYVAAPLRERRLRPFFYLLAAFFTLIGIYVVLFHEIMAYEGQEHSWASGLYWTIVTMTTLGFGDITFTSDLGRIFSVVVLVTGTSMILVLLPFTFIQFVFTPWMERRESARAPRKLPKSTEGHLVLTGLGPIEDALIRRAKRANVPYVLLEPSLDTALRLHDRGYNVMVGEFDDPATYRAARLDQAAMLATTRKDTANSNIVFTAREVSSTVPIVSTASSEASIDILELAGSSDVLRLGELLGNAISQRLLGPDCSSHVVGEFAGLLIAEASVARTPLVGKSLQEAALRNRLGVSVLGLWDRGVFTLAGPDTVIEASTVLILAATSAQLRAYDEEFSLPGTQHASAVIIGGGRVGRSVGKASRAAGVDFKIIELLAERVRMASDYVVGDAAELTVLEEAGIREASSVVITTHDDDVNVYLTLYCRKLRPEIEVVARANLDRNVSTLYRAGADSVLSYASTGATAIWNHFRPNDLLLLAEGLDVFRAPVPRALVGTPLSRSGIRDTTGCNVVAVAQDGVVEGNPDASTPLPAGGELVLIGDEQAEERFLRRYPQR